MESRVRASVDGSDGEDEEPVGGTFYIWNEVWEIVRSLFSSLDLYHYAVTHAKILHSWAIQQKTDEQASQENEVQHVEGIYCKVVFHGDERFLDLHLPEGSYWPKAFRPGKSIVFSRTDPERDGCFNCELRIHSLRDRYLSIKEPRRIPEGAELVQTDTWRVDLRMENFFHAASRHLNHLRHLTSDNVTSLPLQRLICGSHFDGGQFRELNRRTPSEAELTCLERERVKHRLNDSQMAGLEATLKRNLVVIQGPPGTGKTELAIAAIELQCQCLPPEAPPVFVAAASNMATDNAVSYTHLRAHETR